MNITSFYTLLLNDAWTIYMTFSGILISIMTLLYSVILGKHSELGLYAKLQKEDELDPLLKRKQHIAVKVVKRLTRINTWAFVILCISLFNCIFSWISFRFFKTNQGVSLYLVGLLTFIIIITTIGLLRKLYSQYKQDTKV